MRLPEDQGNEIIATKQLREISFDMMVQQLRNTVGSFPDKREGDNTRYSIEDIALSGFSVFFTQSPSFLAFQESMQKIKGSNNAESLFGIGKIPCDNHIRNMLDVVPPETVFPIFTFIAETLNTFGHLDVFRSYSNNILCALDGTEYFSSKKIHCVNCSANV